MKQKTKLVFNRLFSGKNSTLTEQRQVKLAQTQSFLAENRAHFVPSTPMGFKPRSGSAYFFSNQR